MTLHPVRKFKTRDFVHKVYQASSGPGYWNKNINVVKSKFFNKE